ncbi:MAG TPA: hypothetical protein VKN35_10515, partial [Xanthomonadales bacterium]|nr:hypothetical protein [Xanthomonadales bacterium]
MAMLVSHETACDEYRLGPPFNGGWFDPEQSGQGVLLDSRSDGSFLFAGWFTYQSSFEGNPGKHRWWTIEGDYAGPASALTIYLTTGGEFVSGFPVISSPVGTAHITLNNCDSITVAYEFDGGEVGTVELQRLLPVPEGYCDSQLVVDNLSEIVEASTPVVFRDVNLVTMAEGDPFVAPEPASVLVQDGILEAVGSFSALSVPDGAVIIDGRDRFLVPGLIDTHTHLAVNVREYQGFSTPGVLNLVATNQLQLYLAHGVTTIINQGDFGEPQPQWAQEIVDGARFGPTLYPAKYARGPTTSCDGGPPAVVAGTTFEDGSAYVQQAIQDGFRYIKIYNCTPPAAVDGIIAAATASGI